MMNRNTLLLAGAVVLLTMAGRTAWSEDEEFVPVQSTVFEAAKYSPEDGALTLRFLDGREVTHTRVPQRLYEQFMDSRTKGGFYKGLIEQAYPTEEMMPTPSEGTGGEGTAAEQAVSAGEEAPATPEPAAAATPPGEGAEEAAAEAAEPMVQNEPAMNTPAEAEMSEEVAPAAEMPVEAEVSEEAGPVAEMPAGPEDLGESEEADVQAALEEAVDEETMGETSAADEPVSANPAAAPVEENAAVIEDADEEAELNALLGEFDDDTGEQPAAPAPAEQETAPANPVPAPQLRMPARVPVAMDPADEPVVADDSELEGLLEDVK